MNDYPNTIKEKLLSLISETAKSPDLFVRNPGVDFTRTRKLPLETVIHLLISMGGNSIYKELLEAQGYDVETATTSAFVQQRGKILPCLFEFILHGFTQSCSRLETHKGYRLIAVDGSSLIVATDPEDHESYVNTNPNIPDSRGHNMMHMTALFDLCNKLYIDAVVQPVRMQNEKRAAADMVDRSRVGGKVILIADRGYESYNIFAHAERKGWKYLIRVRDVGKQGMLSGLRLPDEPEFDLRIKRILTRKQTNEVKANPEVYRFLAKHSTFDFIDSKSNPFYHMSFRVVRFKITDDSYETVITNLEDSEFSPQNLKDVYAMRWGIETSFRELKYSVGLTNFHSKKREHIVQEIFARTIMYNFAEMITMHVVVSRTDTKHTYQVNFTVAIHICRQFLRAWINAPPFDVEALIRKNILPVRPNRKFKRRKRPKSAVCFSYRVT